MIQLIKKGIHFFLLGSYLPECSGKFMNFVFYPNIS